MSMNNSGVATQQDRMQIFEQSQELQELCRDNGLTATQFVEKGAFVTRLDMFLGFWMSMKSVMYFPALRELSIIKYPTILSIEGLWSCPNLEQLCITECNLDRIANLDACTKLRQLNLSSNQIQKLENLDRLIQLEVLWVNDNQLEKLDGLWKLTNLKQLWVCRNQIERIDSSLSNCVNLTELNLADNQLCSFKTLLHLSNLEKLVVLTLNDPHYGDNPVCRLCNYQTYLMCHLSRLNYLDTMELSPRTKQIAEATMIKKKMYYNMRIKTIKRDAQSWIKHADDIRRQAKHQTENSLSLLVREKKNIELFLTLSDHQDGSGAEKSKHVVVELKKKLECINTLLQCRYGTIFRMNRDFDRLCTKLQRSSDITIARLLLELDTGGNIRLEDGKPSDTWFNSCVELVRSRFFPAELSKFGIQDICITRVTRVNNRYLRNRFHSRMEEILVVPDKQVKDNVSKKGVTVPVMDADDRRRDDDDNKTPLASNHQSQYQPYPGSTLESSLEYLFYVQPPLLDQYLQNKEMEQFFAAENGFREPHEYSAMGLDGAIKLSNTISLLEAARLESALTVQSTIRQEDQHSTTKEFLQGTALHRQQPELNKHIQTEAKDVLKTVMSGEWELPSGVLLAVKVFPGHTKHIGGENDASIMVPSPVNAIDYPGLQTLQVHNNNTVSTHNDAATKPKLYYVFDKALILPEYLVEYQFVLTEDAAKKSPVDGSLYSDNRDSKTISPSSVLLAGDVASPRILGRTGEDAIDLGSATKNVRDFERKYFVKSSMDTTTDDPSGLDESVMRVLQMEPVLPISIQSDNSVRPIERLKCIQMNHVKHLNLLGCQLGSIPDLSPLQGVLETLVLSYNSISVMCDSLRGLTKLKTLDLSYNQITKVANLDTLENLELLEMNNNQLHCLDDLEYIGACFRGRTLRNLDLRNNDICETKRYRLHVIHYIPTLEYLDQQVITSDFFLAAHRLITKITSLTIWNYYRRTKLVADTAYSPSDQLSAKQITSSKNIAPEFDDEEEAEKMSCYSYGWNAVEELVLNRQLIRTIENLEDLKNLRIASFADNAIKRINGLQMCTQLEELSLEDNEITQIEHLETLISLNKLHLGRNRITVIENLDTLENLVQLSLEENQIESLQGLGSALKLMELYVGNNNIEALKEIQHLKSLPKLTILDLTGNGITTQPDYRLYAVHYLRRVKVLDGASISPQEQNDAKQKYSGKLTIEFILEKCGISTNGALSMNMMDHIQDVDLSSCRIREIGTISGEKFPNLRELNLENNQISDIMGLEALPKLKILNLNRNRITKLMPTSNSTGFGISDGFEGKGILACPHLEQLLLGYNQISDMTMLGLQFLDNLKLLHLQGNSITFLAGLDSNIELRELRVDKNRIRQLDVNSAVALRQLKLLNMDDNGIKSLANFNNFLNLQTLILSNNRIHDFDEIERLAPLSTIATLWLTNNPVTKKHLYRQNVLYRLNSLTSLDEREVTAEEKERVDSLFQHERITAAMSAASNTNAIDRMSDGRGYQQAISTNSSMPASMVPGTRMGIPQLAMAEPLQGSALKKNLTTPLVTHLLIQSVNSFPRSDQTSDSNIVIAPSNTTIKGLMAHTQAASYRNVNSLSNQSSYILGGASTSTASPTSTVTVAAALGLNGGANGGGHLHVGGLCSDRRRISSVHYDSLAASAPANPGNPTFPGGTVSSHGVIRGSQSIVGHALPTHPSSAESARKPTSSLNQMQAPMAALDAMSRAVSGYVVSYGNQRRYTSHQDVQPLTLPSYLSTKLNQTNARQR